MNISLDTFKKVHSIMNEQNAVLVYVGDFDQEIIKSMLKYTEDKLKDSGVDELIKRKVFNVMVEMLQNISKHQYTEISETKAIFLILEEEENFLLITGNLIEKDKTDVVSEKIDKINTLDADELKVHYKEARLASRISEVGGAGLGFIDMARKTGNKLDYNFLTIESDVYKFFTLKTKINKVI